MCPARIQDVFVRRNQPSGIFDKQTKKKYNNNSEDRFVESDTLRLFSVLVPLSIAAANFMLSRIISHHLSLYYLCMHCEE